MISCDHVFTDKDECAQDGFFISFCQTHQVTNFDNKSVVLVDIVLIILWTIWCVWRGAFSLNIFVVNLNFCSSWYSHRVFAITDGPYYAFICLLSEAIDLVILFILL